MTEAVPAPRSHARVPSPTGGQYVLLTTVLVATGTYAGTLIFFEFFGQTWLAGVRECLAGLDPRPLPDTEVLAQQQRFVACTAPLERPRAVAALTGGAAVLALALGLAQVLPRVYLRRLGELRPPPPRWPEAMARIAPAFFLTAPPRVWLGPGDLLEAFTIKRGRTPEVIMPAGARRRSDAEVTALLGHEAAHVAAGDVRLVWLTRGTRWALPMVAVLPLPQVVLWLVTVREMSPLDWQALWMWIEYTARTMMLLVAAWVLAARINRAREHEADALTAAAGARAGLAALLSRPPNEPVPFRERISAAHPSHARRRHFLDRTDGAVPYGWPDEMVAGILATTVLVTSYQVTNPGLVGTPIGGWINMIDAGLAGLLITATCGLSWWRRAHRHPVMGWRRQRPVLAMLAGVPIGMLTGVSQTRADGAAGSYINWWSLLTVPLAVASATAISISLAHRWAGGRRRPGPLTPVLVNTVLFGLAYWLGSGGSITFVQHGPGKILLIATTAPWAPFLAAALVAGAIFAWRMPHRRRPLLLSAVAAAAATSGVRLLAPRPAVPEEPNADAWIDLWSAAAAGLAVVLAVLVLARAEDFAATLYASLIATVAASAVIYLHQFGDWAFPVGRAVHVVVYPLAVLATGIAVAALLLPLLPTRSRRSTTRAWPPAVLAAGFAAAMTAGLIHVAGALHYSPLVFRG
ncbi:M48 family metalloprotease [Actinoplanes hulinensis]|uniref:M48 family metalloprotease n=1 Tax=Actinoplanes hulinensis TaxID=1144547 RepID=A0ABS7BH09_9ACTN|nr:M48 family metalloprotease [Actinoplanes hulinensis]MBW6440103.1 M48 family metalloprotease [Actinoplanes hulinensis]